LSSIADRTLEDFDDRIITIRFVLMGAVKSPDERSSSVSNLYRRSILDDSIRPDVTAE